MLWLPTMENCVENFLRRSFEYLSCVKAAEFHEFLLYTTGIVLKKVLSDEMYGHFLAFSVAIRIMNEKDLSSDLHLLEFVHALLIFLLMRHHSFTLISLLCIICILSFT